MVTLIPYNYRRSGDSIFPCYLDARDHGWIRLLLAEYQRFVALPRHRLLTYLRQPLPFYCPKNKRRLVEKLFNDLFRTKIQAAINPQKMRAALFAKATEYRRAFKADTDQWQSQVMLEVAQQFGISSNAASESLFADLPAERLLTAPDIIPSPNEIELRCNLMLVQWLLARSMGVTIALEGNARAVVRHAKWRGLICTLHHTATPMRPVLHISGPLSLFRQTIVYGRHLGELVPILSYCNRFFLQAQLLLGEGPANLKLQTGDPIFPAKPPRLYDSKIEAKLARDLARIAPEWEVIREPEAITAGNTLIFPDFGIRNRQKPTQLFLIEIMGFWTPQYVEKKLAGLRKAELHNFILCIDSERNCSDDDLPKGAAILRFRRRVDAKELMAIIDKMKRIRRMNED
ncbi:MAG: DUF790 family protein [Deltaproteobacteria bacterium]|nr:DUF790 family protein [Deltaproteobacteria bacterium]